MTKEKAPFILLPELVKLAKIFFELFSETFLNLFLTGVYVKKEIIIIKFKLLVTGYPLLVPRK